MADVLSRLRGEKKILAMKINLRFAHALYSLSEGKELSEGEFGSGNAKILLQRFMDTGVIDYRPVGNQRKKYYCADKEKLFLQLLQQFGIPSLMDYIGFLSRENNERSDAVRAAPIQSSIHQR